MGCFVPIAQLAEHETFNFGVKGSSPFGYTKKLFYKLNKRAIADKAYMREMNLTTAEFIALRQWEIIEEKDGANIDVLVGGNTQSMWNVRR